MKIGLLFGLLLIFVGQNLFAFDTGYQFSRLNINNGLSHNQINCIFKDQQGFLWFGTASGLNRYDGYEFKVFKHIIKDTSSINDDYILNIVQGPEKKVWIQTRAGFSIYDPATERFNHHPEGYLAKINIPDQYISNIKQDKLGNYWFLHTTLGIYYYNPHSNKTTHFSHNPHDSGSIHANNVSDLSQDSHGTTWLVYQDGVLERLKAGKNYQVDFRAKLFTSLKEGLNTTYKIFIDAQDKVWAFVPSYSSGVYYYDPAVRQGRHLVNGIGHQFLNTDVIANMVQQDQVHIWIATDHGGINVLDKRTFTLNYILTKEDDNRSISQNSITNIYKDDKNIIWVGTYKSGISYYHSDIIKFLHLRHSLSDKSSMSFNDVNCFTEDKGGNIWIGTNGGGLIYYDRRKGLFKTYLHDNKNSNTLSNNAIVCMYMDVNQHLWLGTYYGGLDCFDGEKFIHYKHDELDPSTLSENRICAISEDRNGHLWVGTLAGGLNELDLGSGKVIAKLTKSADGLHSNYVSAILNDKKNNLWVVTSYGVDVLQKNRRTIKHYIHQENDPNSIGNNNTNNILEDSRGLIWISTRAGISVYNAVNDKFSNIYKQDGLPDNTIIDMQEDNQHHIWASSTNGLCEIAVTPDHQQLKFNIVNYNENEGLQGREFNENSSLKTRDGELLFGGSNGFNLFNPARVHSGNDASRVLFTNFTLFNQNVTAGEQVLGNTILKKAITATDTIELKYNANVFSIAFSAPNYFNSSRIGYQYLMSGFDKGWITATNNIRSATYTNLDPGQYVFKVRATDNGKGTAGFAQLHIIILPPIWKTIWAYLFYAMAFIGGIFLLRDRGIRKLKTQFAVEKEREEAKRMHELDLMKIKFFTNVSHEFRTPLSLIMAPVDKMLKESKGTEQASQLELIRRNAKRLLNMVNQLLDFRKMEHQELKLHTKPGDVIAFLKNLCESFTDIAHQRRIDFIFDTETEHLYVEFDHDKIERIMFNLLSNAYKFTPADGQVSVLINSAEQGNKSYLLEIKIIDTGIGIPLDKLEKVFEPFFQHEVPGNMLNQGSGIGLVITKEFVKMHHGTIAVESEIGKGTCFTIVMELVTAKKSILKEEHLTTGNNSIDSEAELKIVTPIRPGSKSKKLTVLLVEDNEDFRFYLKDNLKEKFNIVEAENGKKGWQKALSTHPNLIVSDVSMPEMSGSELCVKIKHDPRTMHIPVILLTALSGEQQQLEGLKTGAADYMTKPFNFDILESKIQNIIIQQESMRKTYQKQIDANPIAMTVAASPDDVFIKKVLALIDNNIANPNFSVEELSSAMFMSRYTLYKKVLALTGKTPNELVRTMRMKRAANLVEAGHLTMLQIGNRVGFKSQKYFVKMFKEEYGVIPSKYKEDMKRIS